MAAADRPRAYAVWWADPRDRRCLVCGRWVSEAGTSGWGHGFRFCEPCVVSRARRPLRLSAWRPLAAARAIALSGAA